jgi:hypothetical protein
MVRIPQHHVARDFYFVSTGAFRVDCQDSRVSRGLFGGRLGVVEGDCRGVWAEVGEQLDKDVAGDLQDVFNNDEGEGGRLG